MLIVRSSMLGSVKTCCPTSLKEVSLLWIMLLSIKGRIQGLLLKMLATPERSCLPIHQTSIPLNQNGLKLKQGEGKRAKQLRKSSKQSFESSEELPADAGSIALGV